MRSGAAVAGLAIAMSMAGAVHAQSYPTKAVRIVVPLVPGGNLDIVARALAAQMSETFGQQVIVENRPGASSLVGTQFVAKAPADGYALLAIANTFATVPSLMRNAGEITFNGLVAPAATPREALTRVQDEVARIVRLPELRKRYLERGIELVASASPDEFTAYIKTEFDKKARLAREAGIRMD